MNLNIRKIGPVGHLFLAIRRKLHPPRHWVATYGDMGLDVSFYGDMAEYEDAVEAAEAAHETGELDSYTYGDIR